MLAIVNISSLYTCDAESENNQVGLMQNATVVMDNQKVIQVGPADQVKVPENAIIIDGKGKILIPGIVDCHTHSVYAGSRSTEFLRRLNGESYSDILKEGGGILSTVKNTRNSSLEELTELARRRVTEMRNNYGVTTIEIKSGYGLTPQDELKMLLAAKACNDILRVHTTFLGAHTFPMEFRGDRRAEYVKQVIEEQLPICAEHANCVDIFCDRGAFTLDEAREILTAGKARGLTVRAHAEQIEYSGCAQLVAELGGTSADHLEHISEEGAIAMGKHDVVAVMLPGAQLYLKDKSPPVEMFRKHNVKIAVGTDFNPGSSPVHSIWTTATLACILQGLTVHEVLLGITKYAGQAIGRPDVGFLKAGVSVADAVLLNPPAGEPPLIESVIQHMAVPVVDLVISGGKVIHSNV